MTFSMLSHLACPSCGAEHPADRPTGLCGCSSPLEAVYDLDAVKVDRDELDARPPGLWRWHELLPVRDPGRVVSLGEGTTPLLPLPRLGRHLGVPRLLLKDEGLLPTGTFKARGAAVGVSRAAELGVAGVAMPSNGNAAGAWSAYAARAGLPCLVALPSDAPAVTRGECLAAGAEVLRVPGTIADAGRVVAAELAGRDGWQDVATLKEPYRLEGKKTMGLELAAQLGWRAPDVVVYPTGGGVGLLGIRKALAELRALGWVQGGLPRLVAVQASGCAPVVRAFERGDADCEPWEAPRTAAFGLTVPRPLGGALVLAALRESGGHALAVDDGAIAAAQAACARDEGLLPCLEGAATLAAVAVLRESGWLGEGDRVVVLNTGMGAKFAAGEAPA